MGAGHDHGAKSLGEKHRYRLWIALSITVAYMVVQIVAGLLTNSLALLSDAAHMATDALGTAMALAAIIAVGRAAAHPRRTFGLYRLEVLAALANTVLLFGVAIWVGYESLQRFDDPPAVASTPLLIVASIGLVANLAALSLLRSGAKESINVRGAYFEVMGDLLGSIGVIVAAIVIATTGWYYADPVIAIAMAAFILPRAAKLGRDALRILLQTAPPHLDLPAVTRALTDLDGVEDVHDLHVWTLTSGMDVASAHLSIRAEAELSEVLAGARNRLEAGFGINHATLQVEPAASDAACEQPTW